MWQIRLRNLEQKNLVILDLNTELATFHIINLSDISTAFIISTRSLNFSFDYRMFLTENVASTEDVLPESKR